MTPDDKIQGALSICDYWIGAYNGADEARERGAIERVKNDLAKVLKSHPAPCNKVMPADDYIGVDVALDSVDSFQKVIRSPQPEPRRQEAKADGETPIKRVLDDLQAKLAKYEKKVLTEFGRGYEEGISYAKDTLERELNAALTQPSPKPSQEWKPIETAPRDGTMIIVRWESDLVAPVIFAENYDGKGWFGWLAALGLSSVREPTLWQALPAAPSTDSPTESSKDGGG